MSFMQVVEALTGGETGPNQPVSPVYANRKNRESGKLEECLTGNMNSHHRLKPSACKQQFDWYESQIELYLKFKRNAKTL
jgi:hypothetical protein